MLTYAAIPFAGKSLQASNLKLTVLQHSRLIAGKRQRFGSPKNQLSEANHLAGGIRLSWVM
jgi:hypothetical protein